MYRFSRQIYMQVRDAVDPHPDTVSVAEARRRILRACEDTVERLARDARYFPKPARSLFQEIRYYFPITEQARVYYTIEHYARARRGVHPRGDRAQRRGRRRAVPRDDAQGQALPAHPAAGPRVLPVARAPRGEGPRHQVDLELELELSLDAEPRDRDAEQPHRRWPVRERARQRLAPRARRSRRLLHAGGGRRRAAAQLEVRVAHLHRDGARPAAVPRQPLRDPLAHAQRLAPQQLGGSRRPRRTSPRSRSRRSPRAPRRPAAGRCRAPGRAARARRRPAGAARARRRPSAARSPTVCRPASRSRASRLRADAGQRAQGQLAPGTPPPCPRPRPSRRAGLRRSEAILATTFDVPQPNERREPGRARGSRPAARAR